VDSIAADAGPCHAAPANPEVTEENDCAADPNSLASPSQAAAAASIGPEPAPEYINQDVVSGAATKKLIPRVSFP
jgi:hypothetical protein